MNNYTMLLSLRLPWHLGCPVSDPVSSVVFFESFHSPWSAMLSSGRLRTKSSPSGELVIASNSEYCHTKERCYSAVLFDSLNCSQAAPSFFLLLGWPLLPWQARSLIPLPLIISHQYYASKKLHRKPSTIWERKAMKSSNGLSNSTSKRIEG